MPIVNHSAIYKKHLPIFSKEPQSNRDSKKKGIKDSFYIANDKFEIEGKKIRIPKNKTPKTYYRNLMSAARLFIPWKLQGSKTQRKFPGLPGTHQL